MIRGTLLPTPKEQTEPLARQRAHGALVCFARLALLLGIDRRPEGMPERCSGPLHAGVAAAWRAREAPVDAAFLATTFCHRGQAGALLECGGGRRAVAWGAAGNAEPGSEEGASPWKARAQGAGGRARGTWREGVGAVLESTPGGTERTEEGRPEPPRGSEETRIGGPGDGGLDGVEALGHNVCRAPMGRAQAGLQERTAGAWHRLQGGPGAANVTKNARRFVLPPWPCMGERVLQGPREALGARHGVTDAAPTVVDALFQGAPSGARWGAGRQRVAVGAQPCELPGGVGGVILGAAGRKRFAVPCAGQGVDGQEPEAGVCAQGKAAGALVACEAEGDRLALTSRVQGPPPGRHGFWRVGKAAGLAVRGARRL